MNQEELFSALLAAENLASLTQVLTQFETDNAGSIQWLPVGGIPNNRGAIEASADPGRSLVERLTNGVDAILEAEHESHNGIPIARTPREAAGTWLSVPLGGLSDMTSGQRRTLAQRVTIRLAEGEGRDSRVIEVRDDGVGISPSEIPDTILSLHGSNKLQKHYLAGIYGQGGSSTFAVSRYTLIASRHRGQAITGYTVVRYQDLPASLYKTGHYVYLAVNNQVLQASRTLSGQQNGTLVRHYGYDLTAYPSPVGPNSVYGLLNRILFDPILPVWLDNRIHNYRRVIKGSRNALNGAVDEGDESVRGPNLSHNVRMFYVTLPDYGQAGIEYWVLEQGSENKNPIAAFVLPNRSIVLTINGQNQAELSRTIVRNEAELPYLANRLICHIDCNSLSPEGKRVLFVSNREEARQGRLLELIQVELIRALQSDDELRRLNNEARDQNRREQDESAKQQMRREVARLLRLQGQTSTEATRGRPTASGTDTDRPGRPPRGGEPEPIEIKEPPTYIKFVWEEGEPIRFYPHQRRYIRLETNASSLYHDPRDPVRSRINPIISGDWLLLVGSTPLQSGRMRLIVEAKEDVAVGTSGSLRVELSRPGLPTLSDERQTSVISLPPVQTVESKVSFPEFRVEPVEGPHKPIWATLGWPDTITDVASSAVSEDGVLVVYYSVLFPSYATQRAAFERRDTSLAESFTRRYEVWLAVHSILLQQREREGPPSAVETTEDYEREERCRMATLATMFALREAQVPAIASLFE